MSDAAVGVHPDCCAYSRHKHLAWPLQFCFLRLCTVRHDKCFWSLTKFTVTQDKVTIYRVSQWATTRVASKQGLSRYCPEKCPFFHCYKLTILTSNYHHWFQWYHCSLPPGTYIARTTTFFLNTKSGELAVKLSSIHCSVICFLLWHIGVACHCSDMPDGSGSISSSLGWRHPISRTCIVSNTGCN